MHSMSVAHHPNFYLPRRLLGEADRIRRGSSERFGFCLLGGRLPGVLLSALRIYVRPYCFQRGTAHTPDKVCAAPKQWLSVERRKVIRKPVAAAPGARRLQVVNQNRYV